ncbi:MAG: Uma2 family endonuclease [Thermodesulfovibrionales bacterium]|nr:Uma2 family endonuclease [Thermodesulfovibrionales bacterium]
MPLTAEKGIYTYRDYEKLPEGAPYQLIKGELVISPSPMPYYQRILKILEYIIYEHAKKNQKIGEVLHAPLDVYLEEIEVYQSDIIFISKDRLHIKGEKKIEGTPDLIIEILSPSSAYYEVHKVKTYAKHNVREYWIVDPDEKSIEVYENRDGNFNLIEKGIQKDTIH